MKTVVFAPKHSGPCAKQTVTATLTTVGGDKYVSTNFCLTPQSTCPRGDLPSGVGYHMCKEICNQVGHAEEMAIFIAKKSGAKTEGSQMLVEGQVYICPNCKNICKEAGIEAKIKDGT